MFVEFGRMPPSYPVQESPYMPSPVLSTWKEIAAYLGRGVRTVQRWEKELGFPIRRPVGINKHVILAVPEEIDKWVQSQGIREATDENEIKSLRERVKILEAENEELRQQIERTKKKPVPTVKGA
jgi:hypothetical protein